jgi:hypothetical protein
MFVFVAPHELIAPDQVSVSEFILYQLRSLSSGHQPPKAVDT